MAMRPLVAGSAPAPELEIDTEYSCVVPASRCFLMDNVSKLSAALLPLCSDAGPANVTTYPAAASARLVAWMPRAFQPSSFVSATVSWARAPFAAASKPAPSASARSVRQYPLTFCIGRPFVSGLKTHGR